MSWDMQRDSLIHQHGAYSQQVQTYDRQATQQSTSSFPTFPQPQTGISSPSYSSGGGNGAAALGGLVLAGGALVLGVAILNQLWIIAQQAWALFQAATASPGLAGSRLILGGFLLHSAAVVVAMIYATRLGGRGHWAIALVLAVVLWVPALAGFALLGGAIHGLGGFFAALGDRVAGTLALFPPPPGARYPSGSVALVLGAGAVLAGLPLAHLLLRLSDRLLLVMTRGLLSVAGALARLRLLWLVRGLLAAALTLALLAAPQPPLDMPSTLWVHAAIIPALLFGWRAGGVAAVAGVLATPFLATGAGPDETMAVLGRPFVVWGAVFVAAAVAAGWLRSGRFESFGRELWTAILGMALALLAGWGAFVAYFSIGADAEPLIWPGDYMVWWAGWVAESGLAICAGIGIAALAASILRAAGQSFASRAGAIAA